MNTINNSQEVIKFNHSPQVRISAFFFRRDGDFLFVFVVICLLLD